MEEGLWLRGSIFSLAIRVHKIKLFFSYVSLSSNWVLKVYRSSNKTTTPRNRRSDIHVEVSAYILRALSIALRSFFVSSSLLLHYSLCVYKGLLSIMNIRLRLCLWSLQLKVYPGESAGALHRYAMLADSPYTIHLFHSQTTHKSISYPSRQRRCELGCPRNPSFHCSKSLSSLMDQMKLD